MESVFQGAWKVMLVRLALLVTLFERVTVEERNRTRFSRLYYYHPWPAWIRHGIPNPLVPPQITLPNIPVNTGSLQSPTFPLPININVNEMENVPDSEGTETGAQRDYEWGWGWDHEQGLQNQCLKHHILDSSLNY